MTPLFGFKQVTLLKILALFILVPTSMPAAHADVSPRLMNLAATHSGHKALENHAFIAHLKSGAFSSEQIAQFFVDRVYLAAILESLSFSIADRTDSNAPPEAWSLTPPLWEEMSVEKKIFFRSLAYQKELGLLYERFPHLSGGFEPSAAALDYARYLGGLSEENVSVHLWLFLIGETFGAQHISHYIQSKFAGLGEASKSFENVPLSSVRFLFKQWIEEQLNRNPGAFSSGSDDQNSVTCYDSEIGSAYEYLLKTFDAAEDTVHTPSFFEKLMGIFSEPTSFKFGI